MTVDIVNPRTGKPLKPSGDSLVDEQGHSFPVVGGVPRICDADNYASSFGRQWNQFRLTQIDEPEAGDRISERRLFAETGWVPHELDGLDILEVGSGAGRFSRVLLERTKAWLWSVDYSTAVDANMATNGKVAPKRFRLFQASIYELPFPDDSFDKVLCLGVLQHTPDFAQSVSALVAKAKPGAEIVVDFYHIKGFWTKLHAKYLVRPFTRRMHEQRLMRLVRRNAGWMTAVARGMNRVGLHALTRFIPIPDLAIMPEGLPPERFKEWIVLDTFDMLSPQYDNPQRIRDVARMFEASGADVTFAGLIDNGSGRAAVVRAVKRRA